MGTGVWVPAIRLGAPLLRRPAQTVLSFSGTFKPEQAHPGALTYGYIRFQFASTHRTHSWDSDCHEQTPR
ncbi:hypothetical protein DEDE109153_06865 [Deinococcus deserti]